nr:probable galacturonosyltransferase 3 isoform X1 [Ipomoea batatas]
MNAPRLLFTGSCPSASLLTIFLFLLHVILHRLLQVMVYTAVVRAEISFGSTVRTELRDLLPLYDCPECANRKEQSHTGSAARPNEKDIDIIVTYSDASGAVRAMRVKSDNLSKSWVWKNPSDENDDGKESSKELEDPFQMEINSENSNQHSKEDANQYVDGMLHQQASMLHPIKIQRKIQRKERRERRTAELIQQDKEIDNQMQNAAIERAQKLDTTIKGKFNIWRKEYENPNSDSTLKLMRDQIIMARAYATIAKAKNDSTLYNSLMKQSRESQIAMGDASSDAELQPRLAFLALIWSLKIRLLFSILMPSYSLSSALERAKEMGHILSTAKDQLYDCITLARKLRAMLQSSEKGLNLLRKKSAFLIQLAAKTVPRPLRCLPLLLTTDYYLRGYEGRDFPKKEKFEDPSLYHYAIFSDNVLATSVVVNSTVLHAKNPKCMFSM